MYKRKHKALIIGALVALSVTGCSSILSGNKESVSVVTTPVEGATCHLKNKKGDWYVNKTPGSVMVLQAYGDLKVSCHKKGYKDGAIEVKSHTKASAFGNASLGLIGGPVGAAIDIASGAAYNYPTNIVVPMNRS